MSSENFNVETRLAVVERDVNAMNNLYDKLDASITKLTEVASAIKELIAVHEHKFDSQQNTINYVFKELEDIKKEVENLNVEYNTMKNEFGEKLQSVQDSLKVFEKLKWIGIGIATTIGYLISVLIEINPLKYFVK